jgi:hypothetical protein
MDTAVSRARVVLDLDIGADPPTGTLRGENGTEREFSGWLELAKMLEQLRQTARGPEPGATS